MLQFENPFNVPVQRDDVERAALFLCQAQLVEVARGTGLHLYEGSLDQFSHLVRQAIDDPDKVFTVSQLVVQAEIFAMRGAQAMLAMGEGRFHEGGWLQICPLWPFC